MLDMILTNVQDSSPILDRLREQYRAGSRHLLIVPDRFTLSYERAVLQALGKAGTFDVEVVSFSRLADKVLGNRIYRLLDAQSEVMLLRKVIESCKDTLQCFASASNYTGFATEMYAAISQIRNSGVSCEDLERIAPTLPEREAARTRDIVTIYRAYVQALGDRYSDGTHKLEALAQHIATGEYAQYHVYISDFTALSQVEIAIVEQLMLHSLSLSVSLPEGHGDNAFLYPESLYNAIVGRAERNGVSFRLTRVSLPLTPDMRAIADGLFGVGTGAAPSGGERVRLIAARDPEEEVREIARRILDCVRGGMRYRDIAVLSCNSTRYATIVRKVFADMQIPYCMDLRVPLAGQAVATTLGAAMRVVLGGWKMRDVCAYAKQPLTGLDYDGVCAFENYCLKYAIEYNRFTKPFVLGEESEREVPERIRAALQAGLRALMQPVVTAGDCVRGVMQYLADNAIQERIEHLQQLQCDDARPELAEITGQSLDAVLQLCKRMQAMMESVRMNKETFERIFSSALHSVELSNTPMFADSVFVGENGQSRFEDIRVMFVMGASSDCLPVQHAEGIIVSERESVAWSRAGVRVLPDLRARNRSARLDLLMTLLKPSDLLVVSYPCRATSGEALHPSSVVEQIAELTGATILTPERIGAEWNLTEYAHYCARETNAVHTLLEMCALVSEGVISPSDAWQQVWDAMYAVACKQRGKDAVDRLLESDAERETQIVCDRTQIWPKGHTSASQLEKYLSCPFKHYVDHILRAARREEAGMQVSDTGTMLHAIMEQYFSQPDACELSREQIAPRVLQILQGYIADNEKLVRLQETPEGKVLFEQVGKRAIFLIEGMVERMQDTAFRPKYLERAFGYTDRMELRHGDLTLPLVGVIDRVDCAQDRFLVIDYKSKRSIAFDPHNVLFGERIQMFLYLQAMLAQGSLKPAGVFYLLLNDKIVKKDDAPHRSRMTGYLAIEDDTAALFDTRAQSDTDWESEIYPLSCKKGKYSGRCMTTEELESVTRYVMRMAGKAASEMAQGYVAPAPLAVADEEPAACKWCAYKTICGIGTSPESVRRVAKIKQEELLRAAARADEEVQG